MGKISVSPVAMAISGPAGSGNFLTIGQVHSYDLPSMQSGKWRDDAEAIFTLAVTAFRQSLAYVIPDAGPDKLDECRDGLLDAAFDLKKAVLRDDAKAALRAMARTQVLLLELLRLLEAFGEE